MKEKELLVLPIIKSLFPVPTVFQFYGYCQVPYNNSKLSLHLWYVNAQARKRAAK